MAQNNLLRVNLMEQTIYKRPPEPLRSLFIEFFYGVHNNIKDVELALVIYDLIEELGGTMGDDYRLIAIERGLTNVSWYLREMGYSPNE